MGSKCYNGRVMRTFYVTQVNIELGIIALRGRNRTCPPLLLVKSDLTLTVYIP